MSETIQWTPEVKAKLLKSIEVIHEQFPDALKECALMGAFIVGKADGRREMAEEIVEWLRERPSLRAIAKMIARRWLKEKTDGKD
jgi:hypothetical protein